MTTPDLIGIALGGWFVVAYLVAFAWAATHWRAKRARQFTKFVASSSQPTRDPRGPRVNDADAIPPRRSGRGSISSPRAFYSTRWHA